MRAKWIRWAGTLLSIGLFAWLLAQQDWSIVWRSLLRLHWGTVLLAAMLYALYYVGGALRWHILLRSQAIDIPYLQTFKIAMSGGYASNFLPSTVGGDGVRMLGVRRFTENWTVGVTTVVMDRLVGLAAMLSFTPLFFSAFGGLIGGVASSQPMMASAAVTLNWFSRLTEWVKRMLAKVWETARAWLNRPGTLVLALAVGWCSRGLTFVAIWGLALGLGMEVSLYQVIGVSVFTYFVTMLPISINGYGVRELSVTSLYVVLGTSLEQATALAVITRFILMAETLPGAVWMPAMIPEGKSAISGSGKAF